MYVMDIYSVKQPQNIIIKIKIKQHGIGKNNPGKKLIGFVLSVGQLVVELYLHQAKLFS